jgi:hypothetical protein
VAAVCSAKKQLTDGPSQQVFAIASFALLFPPPVIKCAGGKNPMTSRTQYLLFLMLWVGSIFILLFVAIAYLPIDTRDIRGSLLAAGVVALLPATGGYVLIRKVSSMRDKWQLRRGHDVYQERAYEDDGGFIHLNEVPWSEKEQEVSVKEIVSGLGEAAESDDLTKDLK